MNVAVIGGNGYLGTHVADYFCAARLSRRVGFDITQKNLSSNLKDYEVIIHMAALVDKSEKEYEEVLRVNAEGTRNLTMSLNSTQTLIFTSTKDVYDQFTAYATSKRIAEEYVNYYSKKIGFKSGVFRLSTTYAPPTNGSTFVNKFASLIREHKELSLLMKGKQIRDFLYVDDLSEAFKKFIESDIHNATYDIGGGLKNSMTMEDLARTISMELRIEPIIKYSDKPVTGQIDYVTNLNKITKELGWVPKTTIPEGIKRIIN